MTPILTDPHPDPHPCTFAGNEALRGGAVASNCWGGLLTNCVFRGNSASAEGGAVYIAGDLFGGIMSSAFSGNSAESGGAIHVTTCGGDWLGYVDVFDSVLWGDAPDELAFADYVEGAIDVRYTLIEGGWTGDGNIDADPLFVDAESGDLRLQPGSPCIDAADGDAAPEFDIDGNPRVDDPDSPNTGVGPPWADMGAFERQAE